MSYDDDSMAKDDSSEFGMQMVSYEKAANNGGIKMPRGPIIVNYDKLLKQANRQIEQPTEDSIVCDGNEEQKV